MPKKKKSNGNVECVQQPCMNIGLIGHVDAGKTSLVKALTGVMTDTFSEELKRGISIKLGYADLKIYYCKKCKAYTNKEVCEKHKIKTELYRIVSFVDSPGHETLMATMLSGASLMNAALLVVSANEHCPQAQTIEHLQAMLINEVKDIIVVQNKIDLVTKERAIESYNEIKEFLESYGLKNVPIIPVSANLGINIDEIVSEIANLKVPKAEKDKPLKMYCIRSFDANKPGTKWQNLKGAILGGSILQGTLEKGQEIEIVPWNEKDGKGITTKVRSIKYQQEEIEKAFPYGLIAIETLLDPYLGKSDRLKGKIVFEPGKSPEPVKRFKAKIEFLERAIVKKRTELKPNERVVLSIGSATIVATVISYNNGTAEFLCNDFVVVEKGQKFAISTLETMKWRLTAYGIAK